MLKNLQYLRKLEGHDDEVNSVCFSPGGRYALSASSDNTLRLWKLRVPRSLRNFEGHTSSVNTIFFSPDGRYAISGSNDHTLKLWEVMY